MKVLLAVVFGLPCFGRVDVPDRPIELRTDIVGDSSRNGLVVLTHSATSNIQASGVGVGNGRCFVLTLLNMPGGH